MAATKPAYATKAAFDESGLAPYLQTSTKADHCSICLKDLACEASGADHKPLSKAERKLLDEEVDTYHDISDIHHHRRPRHHHHEEEQVGARLKACGHVFGKTCIETWLKDNNSCPMCRTKLFPPSERDIEWDDVNWEEVPGQGQSPWAGNGAGFW